MKKTSTEEKLDDLVKEEEEDCIYVNFFVILLVVYESSSLPYNRHSILGNVYGRINVGGGRGGVSLSMIGLKTD